MRPNSRTTTLLGVLACVALAISGCGESTDSDTPEATDLGQAAELLPAEYKEKGELVVPMEQFYPPFSLSQSGSNEIVGLNVDLGSALGKRLGVKMKFVPVAFDAIIPGIQSSRYDVAIAAHADTPERQEQVDFVDYFKSLGTSVYVLSDNPHSVEGMADLCGRAVGAVKGTYQVGDAEGQRDKCKAESAKALKLSVFPDQSAMILALSSSRIDAMLMETPAGNYVVAQSDDKFENIESRSNPDYANMGMALSKDNKELTRALYAALQELMDDGTYGEVLEKYGQSDGALQEPLLNGEPVQDW